MTLLPPNAAAKSQFDIDYLVKVAEQLRDENDLLRNVLGDLIDALSDEVRYEVSQSPHVIDHIERGCRLLGSAYEGYIGGWL